MLYNANEQKHLYILYKKLKKNFNQTKSNIELPKLIHAE